MSLFATSQKFTSLEIIYIDYRIFDKDTDGKTKNDHFSKMLMEAHKRGFAPPKFASIAGMSRSRIPNWCVD